MIIRDKAPADRGDIDRLLRDAFGGADEAELVARLRDDGAIIVALVAEMDGEIAGHIMLSRLATQVDGRAVEAAALAPLAVRPQRQRCGIGSRLVAAAIAQARRAGIAAVIVLGHPHYYRRFGFSAELAAKLASPVAGPAFMALELAPNALAGVRGSISYPRAFGL
jgi:putative acetyltransferase